MLKMCCVPEDDRLHIMIDFDGTKREVIDQLCMMTHKLLRELSEVSCVPQFVENAHFCRAYLAYCEKHDGEEKPEENTAGGGEGNVP